QEELVEIRPVNVDVTPNTLAHRRKTQTAMRNVWRLRIHVALQTKEPALATEQQHARHSAVGTVASDATFYLHCSVLENKGAALLDMTVNADFPVCFPKHWLIPGSMRTVAVGAFHESFRNAVMARQRELRLNHAMARETEIRL